MAFVCNSRGTRSARVGQRRSRRRNIVLTRSRASYYMQQEMRSTRRRMMRQLEGLTHCSTCTDREQISIKRQFSKSHYKRTRKMPKSVATYRKTAYKLWRDNRELKHQLQASRRTVAMLRNSVQELIREDTRTRIRQKALEESFEKMSKAFSEELRTVVHHRIKRTARKSTAARDNREPYASSESSSEFESPESDVDSVDLAHKAAQDKASQQEQAISDTPASPDAD